MAFLERLYKPKEEREDYKTAYQFKAMMDELKTMINKGAIKTPEEVKNYILGAQSGKVNLTTQDPIEENTRISTGGVQPPSIPGTPSRPQEESPLFSQEFPSKTAPRQLSQSFLVPDPTKPGEYTTMEAPPGTPKPGPLPRQPLPTKPQPTKPSAGRRGESDIALQKTWADGLAKVAKGEELPSDFKKMWLESGRKLGQDVSMFEKKPSGVNFMQWFGNMAIKANELLASIKKPSVKPTMQKTDFATEEEAEAANLPSGALITIGGARVRVR